MLSLRFASGEYQYEHKCTVMGFYAIALLLLLLSMVMVESSAQGGSFNVVEFGAIGNGETDDSKAFQEAWKAVCESSSKENSNLIVPKGKTFLLKKVEFKGPCKSPSISFQVSGKLIAASKKDFGTGTIASKFWLVFNNIDGLIVNGDGYVDGNGSSWWKSCENVFQANDECGTNRPPVLTFNSCKNLQVRNLRITNAPRNHISMSKCINATISNIHITTPGTIPNSDGIDICDSTEIQVRDAVIETGDDCISVNNGCSSINITGVYCGPGHGISIGSLGEHGSRETVENVHVVNCTFVGTQNAARIKTWQGGSGFAKNILFKKITLVESKNPILIDQYYCDDKKHCKNQTSAVAISDVSFIGFTGTSVSRVAVQLLCSESVGCHGLVLDRINITASPNLIKVEKDYKRLDRNVSSTCINAHGTSSDSNIPAVPCLLPE